MNQRERNDLDRHITGNYGEDQMTRAEEESLDAEADACQMQADQQRRDLYVAGLQSENHILRARLRVAQDALGKIGWKPLLHAEAREIEVLNEATRIAREAFEKITPPEAR